MLAVVRLPLYQRPSPLLLLLLPPSLQVLDTVAPPYSQPFARIMISIMQYGLITRMKATHKAMLHEFAESCSNMGFLPPLNAKEQDLLEDLRS